MTLKIGPDKKLNRENASAAAAASIREAIIAGQLRPGQRLKEGDLAEALGIDIPTAVSRKSRDFMNGGRQARGAWQPSEEPG